GIRSPSSSKRPSPTATTVPSWGFSLAVSGMTSPDAVVVSAAVASTRILSSSGLIATMDPPCVDGVFWGRDPGASSRVTRPVPYQLALYTRECQHSSVPGARARPGSLTANTAPPARAEAG